MKPSEARIAGQTAKPLILVVDDDPDLLALLSQGFEGAGFSVITAANGPDALKQAQSQPDLIVLDLVLPDLDGFTVCQTLKKDRATASIPIIMLTGLTSQFSRLAGLECGANDYLRKPVTVAELVATIRTLLGRSANSPSAPQRGARVKAHLSERKNSGGPRRPPAASH